MAELLDLGRLVIQTPICYKAIKNIAVSEIMNGHGHLELQLVIDDTEPSDISRLEQSPIEVFTMDGERVFCGVCIGYHIEQFCQYQELYIEAVTKSYLADIEPKSLTFQSESKTLQSILEQVLAPYGALLSFEQNPVISQMIYQQNETDWAFSRRIANQFGLSLFVNAKANGLQVSVGTIPFSVHHVDTLPDDIVEKILRYCVYISRQPIHR